MKQVGALYLAQAKEFLRDRMTIIFVILLPVAFGVFFGLIFSGGEDFVLTLGLVNEDLGTVGAEIAEQLEALQADQGIALRRGALPELLEALEEGDLHAVIVFPEDMTASIASGQPVTVDVFHDTANATSSGIGLGVVRTLLSETSLMMSGSPPLLQMRQQSVQSNPLRSIDFFMPGMLGVALLWLGVFGTAQPFVAQRQAQIFRRLSVTSITRATILTAEISWRVSVGLLQAALFVLVGYLGYDIGVKSWLPFLASVLLGSLVFVSMGYVLAGLGRTMEGTMAIAQLMNFPMMMLSGSMFSTEMLPRFLQPIVDVLPLTYLSDLLRVSMVGAPAAHPMWLDFAVLAGWLVALIGLAAKLWRWE